jgi:hypothetical protein
MLVLLSFTPPTARAAEPIIQGTADIQAASGTATVTLTWTAPGDDGQSGIAAQYDLRYRTASITESNFATSTTVSGEPVPAVSGTTQICVVTGLNYGTTYYFALKTSDERGNWSPISNIAIRTPSAAVGVGDNIVALKFSAPYPNPARGVASFSVGVPRETHVEIEAYDVTGRLVRILEKGTHPPGESTLVWDLRSNEGQRVSTGVYLVRARIGDQVINRRVIVQN